MTRGGADNVYLSRRQPEVVADPGCTGTLECTLAGLADHVLLLLWLAVMVAVGVGALVFLPRARALCERELRRTRAEYDAFDRFIDRARRITPVTGTPSPPAESAAPVLQRQRTRPAGGLDALTRAYEETVMAVPHFEEEYDETVAEHMREELSDEIAEAVLAESTLAPPLHRSVLDAAVAARDRRAHLLEMLEEEVHSLSTHERELRGMATGVDEATEPLCADQSFDGLREQRDRLESYECRIEDIVNERQADRNAGRTGAVRASKSLDLQEYLYRSMDPPYPVLAEATRLLARVHVTLRRVEDELIYRG